MAEFVSIPDRYSLRLRLHVAASVGSVALLIGGILWLWRDQWEAVFGDPAALLARMWGEAPLQLAMMAIMPFAGVYAWFAIRQTLRITRDAIELESKLPDLFKTRATDWKVRRHDIVEVGVVSRQPKLPPAYRVKLRTKNGDRSFRVFGWFRPGADDTGDGPRRPFDARHLSEQARASAVVTMLEQYGYAVAIADGAVRDPLEATRVGRIVGYTAVALMLIATGEMLVRQYVYLSAPPWLLIGSAGALGAALAVVVLAPQPLNASERALAPVLLGFALAFLVWAVAPRVNGLGNDEPETLYRFDGGVFHAVDRDAPEIWLGVRVVEEGGWRDGDLAYLPVSRGTLGFWQYDRSETVRRVREGPGG